MTLTDDFPRDQSTIIGVCGVNEAAEWLDCSRDLIYRFIAAGELESYVEGNRRKGTLRSIAALIERRLADERCRQGQNPKAKKETAGASQ